MSHNALKQTYLTLDTQTQLHGFSISGLATYLQIPELDLCFDMGECPLSALPLNHIFLTHSHGDHSRCLMRHNSLRKMIGIEKEATYYLPEFLLEKALAWIKAEAEFEGVSPAKFKAPNIIPLSNNGEFVKLTYRKDLSVRSFSVKHSQPSLGYTIHKEKLKLKQEYLGLPPKDIIALREDGVEIQELHRTPFMTFIGDCIGKSLFEEEHIWKSKYLSIETTFLAPDEKEMAIKKGHTHIDEFIEALQHFDEQIECEKIILKHFSMKYSKDYILKTIYSKIPEKWTDRILILV